MDFGGRDDAEASALVDGVVLDIDVLASAGWAVGKYHCYCSGVVDVEGGRFERLVGEEEGGGGGVEVNKPFAGHHAQPLYLLAGVSGGDVLGLAGGIADGGLQFGKPADQVTRVLDGDAGAALATVNAAGPVTVDEGLECGGRVAAVVCVCQRHVAAA